MPVIVSRENLEQLFSASLTDLFSLLSILYHHTLKQLRVLSQQGRKFALLNLRRGHVTPSSLFCAFKYLKPCRAAHSVSAVRRVDQ
jgi:hypothetical protein